MGGVESVLGGGSSYAVGSHRVTVEKQLAEGGFSFVDLVRDDERPGVKYALKRILCQSTEMEQAARAEIALHNTISHPFVMTLIDSDIHPAKHCSGMEALLLFPLYSNGSIVDVVQRYHSAAAAAAAALASSPRAARAAAAAMPYPFCEAEVLRLFYAIGQSLQAMHAAGYAHRDLKPHNVLLEGSAGSYAAAAIGGPGNSKRDSASSSSVGAFAAAAAAAAPLVAGLASEPVPILIDLGSAEAIPTTPADRREAARIQDRAAEHSTASYRAPELWDVRVGVPLDDRADLFSLALTAYYMATGQSAFENETEGVLTLAIRAGNVTFPEGVIRDEEGAGGAGGSAASAAAASAAAIEARQSLHPSRTFSADFAHFIRSMLVPDPLTRLHLRDAMKKSVVLMMAALERDRQGASAGGAPSQAEEDGAGDEDEFGAFASASGSAAAAGALSSALPSPAALDVLITDMQLGSAAASVASSAGSAAAASSSSSGGGGGFLKFGRKGVPHPTRLQLTPSRDALTWTSRGRLGAPGTVNRIPLSRIFGIVIGQVTAKFARAKADPQYSKRAHLCFSLLLRPAEEGDGSAAAAAPGAEADRDPVSGEETLDLLADSHQLFRTWTAGLQALVAHPELAKREDQGIDIGNAGDNNTDAADADAPVDSGAAPAQPAAAAGAAPAADPTAAADPPVAAAAAAATAATTAAHTESS